MTDELVATAVAIPETEMVATVGLPDDQIFILEMSIDPLEHVAVAAKASLPPTAAVVTAGATVMVFRVSLVMFNTALAAIPCPVHAFTVAMPALRPTICPLSALAMATSLF